MAAAKIKLGLQDTLMLGNLDAQRDWGFAGDYVEAMHLMLQQDTPDDYVIATGEMYSVRQFLYETFSIAGLDVDKHVEIDEKAVQDHMKLHCFSEMLAKHRELGWKPKTFFKQLVRMMYEQDLYNLQKKELK